MLLCSLVSLSPPPWLSSCHCPRSWSPWSAGCWSPRLDTWHHGVFISTVVRILIPMEYTVARPRQRVPRTSWRLCRNRRQSSNPWTGSHALTVTWRPSSDKQEREAREPVASPATCLQCWARVSGLGGRRIPISLARLAELTCTRDSQLVELQTIHRFHKNRWIVRSTSC